MMTEFDDICDGILGKVWTVNNHLELDKTDAHPIRSFPYRDDPRARDLEK